MAGEELVGYANAIGFVNHWVYKGVIVKIRQTSPAAGVLEVFEMTGGLRANAMMTQDDLHAIEREFILETNKDGLWIVGKHLHPAPRQSIPNDGW